MSPMAGREPSPSRALAPFRLTIVDGEGRGATCEGDARRALRIGKSPDNDFVLRDRTVSRTHAVVEATPEGYRVRDLKSMNGVIRGGQKIAEAGALLAPGDELHLGLTVLRFELLPMAARDPEQTLVEESRPAAAPPPRPAAPEPAAKAPARSPAPVAPPPSPPPPPPRARAGGQLRRQPIDEFASFGIVEVIDVSDAGELHLGHDARSGADVLLRRVAATPFGFFAKRRFRSAHTDARRLGHPALLVPLDVGQERDFFWVTYPPMHGVTAATLLRDCGRDLTLELAMHVVREVAGAVAYVATSLGPGFRATVSPHEVLVDGSGRVALVHVAARSPAPQPVRYLAPEEDAGGAGDERAAVFSLGVLLYELLAREPIEVAHKTTLRSIDTVRIQVPARLAEVAMRALEVRPDDRFARAADFERAHGEELEALAPGFGAAQTGPWIARHFPSLAGGSP
jgi:pSer/pThr/pTyr-binding forkhead associated (FHA) protein